MDSLQTTRWNARTKKLRKAARRMGAMEATIHVAFVISLGISGAAENHTVAPGVAPLIAENLQDSSVGSKVPTAAQGTADADTSAVIKDILQNDGNDEKPPAVAQDNAVPRTPAEIIGSLRISGDGEKPPAASQDTVDVGGPDTIKDNAQQNDTDDKLPATAQDTAPSRAAAIKDNSRDGRHRAKSPRISRSALVARPTDRRVGLRDKAPLIVESSAILSKAGRIFSVSEPEVTSSGFSILHRGILGQAVDASGAVLKIGKQTLYSVTDAVW